MLSYDRSKNKCCSWCGKKLTEKQAVQFQGCCDEHCEREQYRADSYFSFDSSIFAKK